jgi:hypothetical protein
MPDRPLRLRRAALAPKLLWLCEVMVRLAARTPAAVAVGRSCLHQVGWKRPVHKVRICPNVAHQVGTCCVQAAPGRGDWCDGHFARGQAAPQPPQACATRAGRCAGRSAGRDACGLEARGLGGHGLEANRWRHGGGEPCTRTTRAFPGRSGSRGHGVEGPSSCGSGPAVRVGAACALLSAAVQRIGQRTPQPFPHVRPAGVRAAHGG